MSSFTRKRLRITFYLANGGEFTPGNNTLTDTGLRIVSETQFAGGTYAPTLSAKVYGLSQADMNKLTMLAFTPLGVVRNDVKLEASEVDGVWHTVFYGNIIESAPNYDGAPDAYLSVQGLAMYVDRIMPFPPASFPAESVDVADAIEKIAQPLGYAVERNGVAVRLSGGYYPNTAIEQMKALADHAGITFNIDADGKTIFLTLPNAPRGTPISVLSANSGLVGYPTLLKTGIKAVAYYRPDIKFCGLVEVRDSDVPKANGQWRVCGLRHHLDSEVPHASWLTYLEMTPPNIVGAQSVG